VSLLARLWIELLFTTAHYNNSIFKNTTAAAGMGIGASATVRLMLCDLFYLVPSLSLSLSLCVCCACRLVVSLILACVWQLLAILLLISDELLARGSVQDLLSVARSNLSELTNLIPIAVSGASFVAALISYIVAMASLSSDNAYSTTNAVLMMAGVLSTLFHTIGLTLNSCMLLFSVCCRLQIGLLVKELCAFAWCLHPLTSLVLLLRHSRTLS
jgi:hypothetical protein